LGVAGCELRVKRHRAGGMGHGAERRVKKSEEAGKLGSWEEGKWGRWEARKRVNWDAGKLKAQR
jgi:hypothetical protein